MLLSSLFTSRRTTIKILLLTILDRITQHDASNCTLSCENNGVCDVGQADFSVFSEYSKEHGLPFTNITHINMMYCKCPEGFTGVTCGIAYQSCGTNEHLCLHGSRCKEVTTPVGQKQFRCDCNSVDDASVAYAGLYCEHAATSVCEYGVLSSQHAFCTNDGICVTSVAFGQAHEGCHCKDGYTGTHCEYQSAAAAKAASELAQPGPAFNNSQDGGVGAIIIFGVVMAFCAIVLIAIFAVMRKKRRASKAAATVKEIDNASSNIPEEPPTPVEDGVIEASPSGTEVKLDELTDVNITDENKII